VKDEDGQPIDAQLAIIRLKAAIQQIESSTVDRTTVGLQRSLALAAILLSLAALLWAGLGQFYQLRMSRQAMRSRDSLLVAFLRGKRLLPVFMVVMVVLLFGAAITLTSVELIPLFLQRQHVITEKMLFSALASAILLSYIIKIFIDVIRATRRPLAGEPLRVMGQIVTRAQTPALWSFVGQVAQRVHADMPDFIVVGLNEGFFVTEHAVRLVNGTDVPRGRILYLPLPYMAFLNSSEVAAVIGHELGHFMGEDTVYSQRFAPVYADAIRNLHAVAGSEDGWRVLLTRPATVFGEMFLDSFHGAVRFWSRTRELAADAIGAQGAGGAKAVATSLLRIIALEPHVTEALTDHWDTAEVVAGGVLGHVRQLVAAKGMVDASKHMEKRQPHPFDTHPEPAARLEALGLPFTDELLRRAMDPSGSRLLEELGLEADGVSDVTEVGAQPSVPDSNVDITLQSELTRAAAANRQAKIQELRKLVSEAKAVMAVSEPPLIRVILLAVLALPFLGMGGLILMLPVPFKGILIGLGFVAVGLLPLALAGWLLRKDRKPSLVIRPDGMLLFAQPALLPWSAIDNLAISRIGNFRIELELKLGQQAPAPRLRVWTLRAFYQKTEHKLWVRLGGLSAGRCNEVEETVIKYWQSARAKAELERMGALKE